MKVVPNVCGPTLYKYTMSCVIDICDHAKHKPTLTLDEKLNFLCDLLWNRSHFMTYPVPIQ